MSSPRTPGVAWKRALRNELVFGSAVIAIAVVPPLYSSLIEGEIRPVRMPEPRREQTQQAPFSSRSAQLAEPCDSIHPRLLICPAPRRPPTTGLRGGFVRAQFDVLATGEVSNATAVESSGDERLVGVVLEALNQWRFAPGARQETLQIPFEFRTAKQARADI
ncbi:MAG: TonB family protein [Planctomycetales bacterium]|nr:TonB family protein [Planctomycetales bacterium]